MGTIIEITEIFEVNKSASLFIDTCKLLFNVNTFKIKRRNSFGFLWISHYTRIMLSLSFGTRATHAYIIISICTYIHFTVCAYTHIYIYRKKSPKFLIILKIRHMKKFLIIFTATIIFQNYLVPPKSNFWVYERGVLL